MTTNRDTLLRACGWTYAIAEEARYRDMGVWEWTDPNGHLRYRLPLLTLDWLLLDPTGPGALLRSRGLCVEVFVFAEGDAKVRVGSYLDLITMSEGPYKPGSLIEAIEAAFSEALDAK